MSLINCPECSKQISDKVKACPHCGYPFEESQRRSSPAFRAVAVICPRCGADLEIDEDAEKCFCMYCGSEIMIQKESDGNANSKAKAGKYFDAAMEALHANNMTEALANLEKALEIDPDHYKAIMVKGVCIALNTKFQLLKSKTIISYFDLARTKFMQTNPNENEQIEMDRLCAEFLLYTCTRIFNGVQTAYINDGRKRTAIEYQYYWTALIVDIELALYVLELLRGKATLQNNKVFNTYIEICHLAINVCDEAYKKRSAIGMGSICLRDRDKIEEMKLLAVKRKDDAINMRNRHQEIEQEKERKKYWEEHPDEYRQKKQALFDAQAEQLKIIEENKNKKIRRGGQSQGSGGCGTKKNSK